MTQGWQRLLQHGSRDARPSEKSARPSYAHFSREGVSSVNVREVKASSHPPAAVESTRCTQQKTARRRPLSKSEIMRSQVMPPGLFGVAKQLVRLVPSSDRANLHQRLGRGLLPC